MNSITTKRRVLFINAANPVSEIENRYRPLWPACLASYAEEHLGQGALEFSYMNGSPGHKIESFNPDVVAISSVSQNYSYAADLARIAKGYGLPVIFGGIHISTMPQTMTADMDVGCIGEGEETFLELMRAFLETGRFEPRKLAAIHGIVYRDNGIIVATPPRPLCSSLGSLPHPKRSIIGYQRHDYMFTSRGCPYRCIFCASSRYWEKVRFAPAEYVVEEIRELIGNGVETISFYDDLFIADIRRLREIADKIITNGFDGRVRFTCSCRANRVTPEVVDILRSMNVVSVGLGLESGSDRILQYLKGAVTVEDNRRAVNLLKDAGIQANASFVIGSPDETEEEILQTYEFIKKSRLDFVDAFLLIPYPGTKIWDYAAERNLVSDSMDWNRLNVNIEFSARSVIILSETLTRRELLRLYRKFRRLRLYRILKALPFSPWRRDVPKVLAGVMIEYMARLFSLVKKYFFFLK